MLVLKEFPVDLVTKVHDQGNISPPGFNDVAQNLSASLTGKYYHVSRC